MHAASVNPEPGSNSHEKYFYYLFVVLILYESHLIMTLFIYINLLLMRDLNLSVYYINVHCLRLLKLIAKFNYYLNVDRFDTLSGSLSFLNDKIYNTTFEI